MAILFTILSVLVAFVGLTILIGFLLSGPAYSGPVTDHFNGKKFLNPSGLQAKGLENVLKYFQEKRTEKWFKNYETDIRKEPIPNPIDNQIQYTFVNHSTFLIQNQGINILTDPIWSERCSPFQFAGPARMRPPGIPFENLPKIDLVLLSHNHYDHLDTNTVRKIEKQWSPTFIVPLGLKKVLEKLGCRNVIEIDWWEAIDYKDLNIKAVPANHFSSRGMFDRDVTLWAGYVVKSESHKIYFLGDSGYSDIFKTIGEREGPFDLSFIPIGAYLPEWFMSPIHISPEQAVQVHLDVKSRQSVAMHFGTFPLALDGPERAPKELIGSLEKRGLNLASFFIPDEGGVYILPN
jgi:L-ascorbate metabolism protein UlaG (beta-lactamase superfamily)